MSEIVEERYSACFCALCGVKFWIPTAMHAIALQRGDEFTVWCPNGHQQHWEIQKIEPEKPSGGEVVKFEVVK